MFQKIWEQIILSLYLSEEVEDGEVSKRSESINEGDLVPDLRLSRVSSAESRRSKKSKSKFCFERYENKSYCRSVY